MEKVFFAFGTMNQIRTDEKIPQELLEQMSDLAERLDDKLSVFKADSEISKINENAGIRPVEVSPLTIRLLKRALYFSELSQGAFDITIRPAVKQWNIGHKEQRVPSALELEEIRPLIDYRMLEIDYKKLTVYLKKKGQAIDLGGIAKGYAGDLIKEKLIENGVKSAILNFGGTILTIGTKPDGSSFRVGIQNPLAQRGKSVGMIELNNASLVTSAVNERFFMKDGRMYHHLLDPITLGPAQSGVLSVSATGTSAMDLDALTTALFVMGLEKGIELAKELGIEVIYLLQNGEMYATQGFAERKLNFKSA